MSNSDITSLTIKQAQNDHVYQLQLNIAIFYNVYRVLGGILHRGSRYYHVEKAMM